MPSFFTISEGKLVQTEEDKASVFVYACPSESEKRLLIERFGLDEHTLNSATDPDELARIEHEDDHLGIIFKRPKNYSSFDQLDFKVTSVGFFLFRERLVVVMAEDGPLYDGRPLVRVQSLHNLVIRILSRTIGHFVGHLKVFHTISGEIERRIESSSSNSHLLQLLQLEKSLVYYINAIQSNGATIDHLRRNAANPATPGLGPDDIDLLDELIIDNRQCHEQAMIHSNILASLSGCRAAIIGNNLNVMMKNLNALVIAVAVPSFIAGVGGMSEFSGFARGGADAYGLRYYLAYGLFMLGMAAMGAVTFYLIRRLEQYWR